VKQHSTVVLLVGALLGLLGGCATTDRASAPAVPEALRVSASQVLFVRARGVGVQIYECRSSPEEPAQFAWVLKAPDAQLSDRAGKPITVSYTHLDVYKRQVNKVPGGRCWP